jgi:hypothetical protein
MALTTIADPHPRVDGRWLTDLGSFGDVTYTEAWRGGCESASWSMNSWASHHCLHAGARVDIYDGPAPVWAGILAQPDTSGQYTAYGLSQRGKGVKAIDGGGTLTLKPHTAVVAAINRGAVPWSLTVPIEDTDIGDSDTQLGLNDLLNRYSDATGNQWRVDHRGQLVMEDKPTTPRWAVSMSRDLWTPDDSNLVTHLNVTYFDTGLTFETIQVTTPDSAAAAAMWGHVERSIEISDQGIKTSGEATAYGQAVLAQTGPKLQLVDPIVLAPGQLRSLGDTAAGWTDVHAGQMIRLWGVPDRTKTNTTPYSDVIIGRVQRSAFTLTLTPYGAPARTFEDVIADMAARFAA